MTNLPAWLSEKAWDALVAKVDLTMAMVAEMRALVPCETCHGTGEYGAWPNGCPCTCGACRGTGKAFP